jgi:hypothetical protein
MVVKRGKDTLPSLLAFLNQILTTHLAAPPEAKNHQQKDAALLVLGWLDEMLKSRRRPYRASLEGLLLTHVFPEFG